MAVDDTNTSSLTGKAGVRCEAKHGAAGEKQVRGNMAVDDTTDHSLPSWGYPVFAAVCLTGEAGVGQHGSTFQSGHKHKQSRCV